jgi:hypothetical protein
MGNIDVREWEYLDGGVIVINGGEETLRVHPSTPRWIVAGNMARRVNRPGKAPEKAFVLSITDRCNIRCDFCCHPYQNAALPEEDCIRMVTEACAADFDEICVTGGEPYLCRALIYKLAAICKEQGKLFGSISNGFWAKNREKAFSLAREMVECGVARITFSWDPSHGAFIAPQTIQNGIDACMQAGIRVCLTGSFKQEEDCHENYGIDVSAYKDYANFAVVNSYVIPAGWGKSLTDLYHAPVTEVDAAAFRCPAADAQELVIYAQEGLVQPCCSVHAGYDMPNLRVGDWRKQPVSELLEAQQGDGFFRIIVDGGFKLLYKIIEERAPELFTQLPAASAFISPCHLCEKLMALPDALRIRKICDDYLTESLIEKIKSNPDIADQFLLLTGTERLPLPA